MAFWHPFADMAAVARRELLIERGEGPWVFDADGTRYLDATASLWYANIGHGRVEVADAVAAQIRRLEAYHTFTDVSNRPANELCERLAERAPMPDSKIFLTSGGGDSVEVEELRRLRRAAHLRDDEVANVAHRVLPQMDHVEALA